MEGTVKRGRGRPRKNQPQTYTEMVESGYERTGNLVYKNERSPINAENISSLVSASLTKLEKIARQTENVVLKDTETIKTRSMLYIRSCQDVGVIPSLMGFAVSIGYSYDAIQDFRKRFPEHPTTQWLKMLKDEFGMMLFNAGLYNYVNMVGAIFGAKAMYKWKDVVTLEAATPTDPLGSQKSPAEIAEYYTALDEAQYNNN